MANADDPREQVVDNHVATQGGGEAALPTREASSLASQTVLSQFGELFADGLGLSRPIPMRDGTLASISWGFDQFTNTYTGSFVYGHKNTLGGTTTGATIPEVEPPSFAVRRQGETQEVVRKLIPTLGHAKAITLEGKAGLYERIDEHTAWWLVQLLKEVQEWKTSQRSVMKRPDPVSARGAA